MSNDDSFKDEEQVNRNGLVYDEAEMPSLAEVDIFQSNNHATPSEIADVEKPAVQTQEEPISQEPVVTQPEPPPPPEVADQTLEVTGEGQQVLDARDGHVTPDGVPHGSFMQPDSLPRNFDIGRPINELIRELTDVVQIGQALPPTTDDCVPPPGTISFEAFIQFFEGVIDDGEGIDEGFFEGFIEFMENFGDPTGFTLSVAVETFDQLAVTNALFSLMNLITEEFNNEYGDGEMMIRGDYTIFLGDGTYNFTDRTEESGGLGMILDNNPDLDTYVAYGNTIRILGCGCEHTQINANDQSRIFDIHGQGEVIIEGVELTGGHTDPIPLFELRLIKLQEEESYLANEYEFCSLEYLEQIAEANDQQDLALAAQLEAELAEKTAIYYQQIGEIDAQIVDLVSTLEQLYEYNYDDPGLGGAILTRTDLTVLDSCVVDNCAEYGGGIYSDPNLPFFGEGGYYGGGEGGYGEGGYGEGGKIELNVINSIVNDNNAKEDGGGIYAYNTDVNVIENSQVNMNQTGFIYPENLGEGGGEGEGGGDYFSGNVDCDCGFEFEGNGEGGYGEGGYYDDGNNGGGIYLAHSSLVVDDSTVNDNRAEDSGGGIYAWQSYVQVQNGATVNGNWANTDEGGGIWFWFSEEYGNGVPVLAFNGIPMEEDDGLNRLPQDGDTVLLIDNASVDWNRAENDGGGIYFYYVPVIIPDVDELETPDIDIQIDGLLGLEYYVPFEQQNGDYEDPIYNYQIINNSTVSFNRIYGNSYFDDYYYYYYDDGRSDGAGLYQYNGYGLIDESTFDGNIISAFYPENTFGHSYLDLLLNSPFPPVDPDFLDEEFGIDLGLAPGALQPGLITEDHIEMVTGGDYNELDDLLGSGRGAGIYVGTGAVGESDYVAMLTILSSTISRNLEYTEGEGDFPASGAGLYNNESYIVLIDDTVFSQNQALGTSDGGAIYNNDGYIGLIVDSFFLQNAAGSLDEEGWDSEGGAIYNEGYIDQILRTSFIANTATEDGGAIYNDEYINSIYMSNFRDNLALDDGGAISNDGYLGYIDATTIHNNFAAGDDGGGLYIADDGYVEMILRSTFSSNYAGENGGGIYINNPYYERYSLDEIFNSTISGNTAGHSGGGIYLDEYVEVDSIYFTTIAFNEAMGEISGMGTVFPTGGLHVDDFATIDDLFANIIDNNSSVNSPATEDIFTRPGSFVGGSSNITELGNFVFVGTFDFGLLTTADSLLDPNLADNGTLFGTQTHALLVGSPAIDAVSDGVDSDQRGFERPFDVDGVDNGDGSYDIGAYEFGASPPLEMFLILGDPIIGLDGTGLMTVNPSGEFGMVAFNTLNPMDEINTVPVNDLL